MYPVHTMHLTQEEAAPLRNARKDWPIRFSLSAHHPKVAHGIRSPDALPPVKARKGVDVPKSKACSRKGLGH